MKYAKFKNSSHTYFEVDEVTFNGRCVFVNGENAAISTYNGGKKWFAKLYEPCKKEEFDQALLQAKKLLNVL